MQRIQARANGTGPRPPVTAVGNTPEAGSTGYQELYDKKPCIPLKYVAITHQNRGMPVGVVMGVDDQKISSCYLIVRVNTRALASGSSGVSFGAPLFSGSAESADVLSICSGITSNPGTEENHNASLVEAFVKFAASLPAKAILWVSVFIRLI